METRQIDLPIYVVTLNVPISSVGGAADDDRKRTRQDEGRQPTDQPQPPAHPRNTTTRYGERRRHVELKVRHLTICMALKIITEGRRRG